MCQSEGTHKIVMSCLPRVVGTCFAQKKLTKEGGGGVTGTPGSPLATPLFIISI